MERLLSACMIDLTSYALYVALLVVSPFIAPKYVVLFGIPASCSVLIAPFLLGITYFFTKRYGASYGYKLGLQTVVMGFIMVGILWLVSLVPMSSKSVVSIEVWNEVLSISPKVIVCWTLLYGLAHWGVVWCSQRVFLYGFSLGGVIQCGCLAGWLFLMVLVYMKIVPMSVKVLGGSFIWFGIVTIVIDRGLYLMLFIINNVMQRDGWMEDVMRSVGSPVVDGLYQWLLALFWLILLLTNVVMVKCFAVKSYFFTVGLLTYPFTFVCTDLIGELYGKQKAQWAVWAGFLASTSMMIMVLMATWVPIYRDSPVSQKAFSVVFSFTPGIILASMLAYISSQLTDIYLFEALRIRTKGRHLWLRNNVATMFSQFVDTVVFAVVAWMIWSCFTSSALQIEAHYWYQVSLNEYIGKIGLALLDTPLVYVSVRLLKKYV